MSRSLYKDHGRIKIAWIAGCSSQQVGGGMKHRYHVVAASTASGTSSSAVLFGSGWPGQLLRLV
jgi:hypothetical protein